MNVNPVLKALGFSEQERLVIIHTDDIGMCQASLAAYMDLVRRGGISAASTMVPCPWFPATAHFCRAHPDLVDMGVHVTLTSEWEGYRWSPVSTRDPASGLLDADGYLHQERAAIAQQGDPSAVEAEIAAQVQRALDAGIDVTHIDTHMGTVFNPQFVEGYVRVALRFGVPPMIVRQNRAELQSRRDLQQMQVGPEVLSAMLAKLRALEAQGVPLLDYLHELPLAEPKDRVAQVKAVLGRMPVGITYLIIHPAKNTPELRAITPDWRGRVADYEAFMREEVHALIRDAGVHVIGWRMLRDWMRENFSSARK